MTKLQMTSIPARIPVTIKQTIDGDVIDGLELVLEPVQRGIRDDNTPGQEPKSIPPDE
jgi:hypothetical protein